MTPAEVANSDNGTGPLYLLLNSGQCCKTISTDLPSNKSGASEITYRRHSPRQEGGTASCTWIRCRAAKFCFALPMLMRRERDTVCEVH